MKPSTEPVGILNELQTNRQEENPKTFNCVCFVEADSTIV